MTNLGEQLGVPFNQEEYDRRLNRVRSIMKGLNRGIEVLMIREPINIFYMTGYNTFGILNYEILFIPLEGEASLLVRHNEESIAYVTSWVKNVHTWDDHEDPYVVTKKVMKDNNWLNKLVGFDKTCKFFSPREFQILSDTLGIDLIDGGGIVEEVRKIKSPAEIEFIRKAARFTEIGMRAGMDNLAEGKTENEVVAKVYEAMIAAGSEYPSTNPVLTGGWKSGIGHTTFHRLELKRGDVVLYEIGGVYNRYTGALIRGAVIGEPIDEVKRMNYICAEAVQAAIDKIKPGVTSGEVDEACQQVMIRAGYYKDWRKRTGYSIGCAYPPTWNEGHIFDLKKDDPRLLKEGMVFHIFPVTRNYGKYGLGVSETVLVTNTGCEVLTNFDRSLYIAK